MDYNENKAPGEETWAKYFRSPIDSSAPKDLCSRKVGANECFESLTERRTHLGD